MMRKNGREWDQTDDWCAEWAGPLRSIYGVRLDKMIEPRERVGKLRSTLASVKEEGEGASYGTITQKWPEVYTPMGMLVHRCFVTMGAEMRNAMMLDYVFDCDQWPISKRVLDYGTTLYLHNKCIAEIKIYLNGFLAANPIPDDDSIFARSA